MGKNQTSNQNEGNKGGKKMYAFRTMNGGTVAIVDRYVSPDGYEKGVYKEISMWCERDKRGEIVSFFLPKETTDKWGNPVCVVMMDDLDKMSALAYILQEKGNFKFDHLEIIDVKESYPAREWKESVQFRLYKYGGGFIKARQKYRDRRKNELAQR